MGYSLPATSSLGIGFPTALTFPQQDQTVWCLVGQALAQPGTGSASRFESSIASLLGGSSFGTIPTSPTKLIAVILFFIGHYRSYRRICMCIMMYYVCYLIANSLIIPISVGQMPLVAIPHFICCPTYKYAVQNPSMCSSHGHFRIGFPYFLSQFPNVCQLA